MDIIGRIMCQALHDWKLELGGLKVLTFFVLSFFGLFHEKVTDHDDQLEKNKKSK